MTTPQTVSDLFPSPWLSADDIGERVFAVRISAVSLENIRQRDGQMEIKAILSFEKAHKRMILNKTQAYAVAAALGSQAFADWPGQKIRLSVGRAPNGKDTIIVRPDSDDQPG